MDFPCGPHTRSAGNSTSLGLRLTGSRCEGTKKTLGGVSGPGKHVSGLWEALVVVTDAFGALAGRAYPRNLEKVVSSGH